MYSLMMLNGGSGTRVGAGRPKQLVKLRGIPILVYSMITADRIPEITQIVLNYPPGWRSAVEEILADFAIATPTVLVEAGATRHSSVDAMLSCCSSQRVLIHESARPLASRRDFERLIADPHDNVALMAPIPFTVAPVDPTTGEVTGYLDRERLRNVQLPQKFLLSDLVDAHRRAEAEHREYTEDATLVATSGHEVFYIDGSDANFKVTTPTDLRLAGFLLRHEEDEDD